ncbi:FAD-binding oxidoreductase [Candidatus Saccharibacteria bacterium]|nr:FAD-binding oxidoreductase [Candidatus Saccharibacteria bacterium]
MNKIAKYLNQHIVGNVYDKPSILEAYSTDNSILKITPRFVALPKNTDDIRRLVRFSNQLSEKGFNLPITVRGSGLDKTGADLGSGMVISTEHLNEVLEIDERSRLVRTQAGATLEKLQAVLAEHGLTIPVHHNPKETIGGLIASFPSDPLARRYGSIYYYVDRLEAVLATGDCIQTTNLTLRGLSRAKNLPDFEGSVYRGLDEILNSDFDTIEDLSSLEPNSRGYRMICQVFNAKRRTFDLLPLFFGSQGTLGVISEIILQAEPMDYEPTRMAIGFKSIRPAMDFLQTVSSFNPIAVDIYDARIFRQAAEHGKEIEILQPMRGKNFYIIATFTGRPGSIRKRLKKLIRYLPESTTVAVENPDNTDDFTELDSAISSYLNDDIAGERTPIVDGAYIPIEHLANFLVDLKTMEEAYGFGLHIFGSCATETYSVRPELDFNTIIGRQDMVRFLSDYHNLIKSHDGALVIGGGEGRVKGAVTNDDYQPIEKDLYLKIKNAFDPHNILAPEAKLGADHANLLRNLRTTTKPGIISK